MTRSLFTCILFLIASIAFAQQKESEYSPPMPFIPFTDSYQYGIQKLYESLPKTDNLQNVPGTTALASAEIRNVFANAITWEEPNNKIGRYWKGENLLPIGTHKIEVRTLNNDRHFWYIYGKVQFFSGRHLLGVAALQPPVNKTVQNYIIVLHFNKGSAQAHVDFFMVGPNLIKNNKQTLDLISKKATTLLSEANKEAYEEVKTKSQWTIDKKSETGNFDSYRGGRVTLTKNNTRTTYNVALFSYEDQLLIRRYIDHQGIPR